MYNYYYISLPNISELKQKVLVFSKEEKTCELPMMNLKAAHSPDGCQALIGTPIFGRPITESY